MTKFIGIKDGLRFNLFFEKIFGYIDYIIKEDNKIITINGLGISYWILINDALYFDYFISKKHKRYGEVLKWITSKSINTIKE